MEQPLVSIIISNLNGRRLKLLDDCVESLCNPHYANWELIVVDNNSDDDSVVYLKRRFKNKKNCKVIQNNINMYSQGLNLGAKNAQGKYLAFFNNDVAIPPKYFDEIIGQFETDSKLGIAQGKLLNYFNRDKIDSAGETMDKYGNPITIGAGEIDKGQFDTEEQILSASGSACVIKKSVFEKIGSYDNDYGIGYEDMDLALRARRLGFYVKRFPKAIVYHKRASTDLAPFIRLRVKWHFNKNRITTMIKNYPLTLLITTLPITLLLYFTIALWEWTMHRNWAIGWMRFTAIGWIATHFPQILSKRKQIISSTFKNYRHPMELFSQKSIFSIFKDFLSFHK